MRHALAVLCGVGWTLTAFAQQSALPTPSPWTLKAGLGLPDWLDLRVMQRTRYEWLDGQFRAGGSGSDQGLYFRTEVLLRATGERFEGTLEVMDSRQGLADMGSAVNSSNVNTIEPIQMNASVKFADAFHEGAMLKVTGGRMTLGLGSQRLVERSNFTNTVNTFDGVHAVWKAEGGAIVQAFSTLPVTRFPTDLTGVLDNNTRLDESDFDVKFWGIYAQAPLKAWKGLTGEVYIYGLDERDDEFRRTRDRELYTLGSRVFRAKAAGAWDFEVELMAQAGQTRASTAVSDTTNLEHRAWGVHADAGYTWEGPHAVRLALELDFASGDEDPTDDESNRFDPLFGGRTSAYGPTGIFGPFSRSNSIAVGPRFTLKPAKDWTLMAAVKGLWLAEDRDAWVVANVRDPSGESGSFLGVLAEVGARYEIVPKQWSIGAGAAYLSAGEFIDDAPNVSGEGDSSYVYVDTTFRF